MIRQNSRSLHKTRKNNEVLGLIKKYNVPALKRCTCDCARELIVRSTLEPLHDPLGAETSCRLRRTTQRRAARFRRHVALGSRPAQNAVQPARSHQAASQSGRADQRNRSRSYPGHLHHGTVGAVARASATRQVVAHLSPSRFTSVARQGAALVPYRRAASRRGALGDRTPGRTMR